MVSEQSHIPLILNLDDHNYDTWRELFFTHCLTFDVAGILMGVLYLMEPTMFNGTNEMDLSSCGSTVPYHQISSAAPSKLVAQL